MRARRNQKSAPAVANNIAAARHSGCYDRQSGERSLKKRARYPLPILGREREYVREGEQGRYVGSRPDRHHIGFMPPDLLSGHRERTLALMWPDQQKSRARASL